MPCGSSGAPALSSRVHLMMAPSAELDDPSRAQVTKLFHLLSARNGSLGLIGDSQMTNLQVGMECDMYFEKLHAFQFGSITKVNIKGGNPVSIQRRNKKTVELEDVHSVLNALRSIEYTLLVVNAGTHYNNELLFRKEFEKTLPALNQIALTGGSNIDIVWVETPPQHWDTPNGYWNSVYTDCVPLKNISAKGDWRNFHVYDILKKHNLTEIKVLKLRDLFLDLYREHHRGKNSDCTHYCYWPMLYRDVYEQLIRIVMASSPISLAVTGFTYH